MKYLIKNNEIEDDKDLEKWFRKFKSNISAGHFFVNSRECIYFVFNLSLRAFIQMYFNKLIATQTNSGTFTDDFRRIYKIWENIIINRCESATERNWKLI